MLRVLASAAALLAVVVPGASAAVTPAGATYTVTTGADLGCPSGPRARPCTVVTELSAIVQPPGASPRMAVVARTATTMRPGATRRLTARLNALGAAELRRVGAFRALVTVDGDPFGHQTVTIPGVVLPQGAAPSSVVLAPGQKLVVPLTALLLDGPDDLRPGWLLDPLPEGSALQIVSRRNTSTDLDCARYFQPSCTKTTLVFAGVRGAAGTTVVTLTPRRTPGSAEAGRPLTITVTSSGTAQLPRQLRAADHARTIDVEPGKPFTVTLGTEAGDPAGATWRVLRAGVTDDVLSPFSRVTVPTGPRVATELATEFAFTAKATPAVVSLGLYAPGSRAPARTFRLTVAR